MGCAASTAPDIVPMRVATAPAQRFVTVTLQGSDLPPVEALGVDGYCKVGADRSGVALRAPRARLRGGVQGVGVRVRCMGRRRVYLCVLCVRTH